MENKYTYYKPKNSEMMANVYFNKLVVAHFESEKDAQDYIAWKNQPMMNKETKIVALDCLKAIKIYGIRPADYNFEYLDKAIEIISNLPTGEN